MKSIPGPKDLAGVYDENHKDSEAREWARAVLSCAQRAHQARLRGEVRRERVWVMLARVAANAYAQRLVAIRDP